MKTVFYGCKLFLMGLGMGAVILSFLLMTGIVAQAEIYQGYFLVSTEDVQHEQQYREQVGTETVDILDYGPPILLHEPDVVIKPVKIGEKEVPVYEWRVRKWTTKRPALGMDLRDYQGICEYGGQQLIYVITSNKGKWTALSKKLEYLGSSIQEIVRKALKDSAYLPIAQRLLYSSWHTGVVDEGGNKITKRSHMADWIVDGKPKLLDTWWPKVQYAGVPCKMPTSEAAEGKSEIELLIEAK